MAAMIRKALWAAMAMIVLARAVIAGTEEVEALMAFKKRLTDPRKMFATWDENLVDPCTWLHITCNADSQATRIDLANAGLSGTIAPELGNLKKLQYLELQRNHLQGDIPSELGGLSSLISLDLYENSLTGRIPPSLANLKQISFMRLSNNKLSGPIPPQFKGLYPNMRVLDVSNNNLCGPDPWGNTPVPYNFNNNLRFNMRCL